MPRLTARLVHGRATFGRPLGTVVGLMTGVEVAVAIVADDDGHQGVGYLSFPSQDSRDAASAAAARLLESCPLASAVLAVEDLEETGRLVEPSLTSRAGASAVSQASWDLVGHQLGISCSQLWGGGWASRPLSTYASGLFLDSTIDDLVAEATDLRHRSFPSVKMRVGLEVDVDVERVRAVRTVYPEAHSVAVDAYGGWSLGAARQFNQRIEPGLLWVEDPVAVDDLSALVPDIPLVAGGETCWAGHQLLDLADAGVGILTPDVQFIGGPIRWLRAARTLEALGVRVGSHVFPHQSVHLLSCLADPLPLEILDWWDPLFDLALEPSPDGTVSPQGPGWGIGISPDWLDRSETVWERAWDR